MAERLDRVEPLFIAVFEEFQKTLVDGLPSKDGASICTVIDLLAAEVVSVFPGPADQILAYLYAAKANLAMESFGTKFPGLSPLLSSGEERWRLCLSLAWDMTYAAATAPE